MKTTELVCKVFGEVPPNQDPKTGIHYGVIPQNELGEFAMNDIIQNGTDLGYESALDEFKSSCRHAAKAISQDSGIVELLADYFDDPDDEETTAALEEEIMLCLSWLSEYADRADRLSVCQCIMDDCGIDPSEEVIYQVIFDGLEPAFSDSMCMAESGPYRYEAEGYIIEEGGHGDLFVIKSPYMALCRECSPCAPNAGYLTSEGSMPTYCLGPEWFDDDKPPYDVFKVADGSPVHRSQSPATTTVQLDSSTVTSPNSD